MNKKLKQYLLGYIYEELEKNVFNVRNGHGDKRKLHIYESWLKQLDNKQIIDSKLKTLLLNMKECSRIYDMPRFIDLLLQGSFYNDKDLEGKVLNFKS